MGNEIVGRRVPMEEQLRTAQLALVKAIEHFGANSGAAKLAKAVVDAFAYGIASNSKRQLHDAQQLADRFRAQMASTPPFELGNLKSK